MGYYDRNDWLKLDVYKFLEPWVDQVSRVYNLKKQPAKYIVTYALSTVVLPEPQHIANIISLILNNPGKFQKKYGTRIANPVPNTTSLRNPLNRSPLNPRKANFMDLVDCWAVPMNKELGIPIIQSRDVTKISLAMSTLDYAPLLSAIRTIVFDDHSPLFNKDDSPMVFQKIKVQWVDL